MARDTLSATMADTLATIQQHGGEIVCWRGGFWTYPECPIKRRTPDGYDIPTWYAGTSTIRALADRKRLEFTERLPRSGMPVRGRVLPEPACVGSYGFTCGYCETNLDTPFDDGDRASQFAQEQGWRMTCGPSPRWGDGAHNTCPSCAEGDKDALPIWMAPAKRSA